jgi:hypothetical protein
VVVGLVVPWNELKRSKLYETRCEHSERGGDCLMGKLFKDHTSERVYDQEISISGFGLASVRQEGAEVPFDDRGTEQFRHFRIRGTGGTRADAWGDFFRELYHQLRLSKLNVLPDIYWRRMVEESSVREFDTGETTYQVSARFSIEVPSNEL